jgi:hypothetical protein
VQRRLRELAEVDRLLDKIDRLPADADVIELEGRTPLLTEAITAAAHTAAGDLVAELQHLSAAREPPEGLRRAAHIALACVETLVDCWYVDNHGFA